MRSTVDTAASTFWRHCWQGETGGLAAFVKEDVRARFIEQKRVVILMLFIIIFADLLSKFVDLISGLLFGLLDLTIALFAGLRITDSHPNTRSALTAFIRSLNPVEEVLCSELIVQLGITVLFYVFILSVGNEQRRRPVLNRRNNNTPAM
jgi:hypothetical protein